MTCSIWYKEHNIAQKKINSKKGGRDGPDGSSEYPWDDSFKFILSHATWLGDRIFYRRGNRLCPETEKKKRSLTVFEQYFSLALRMIGTNRVPTIFRAFSFSQNKKPGNLFKTYFVMKKFPGPFINRKD